jgi:hypothetical protein
VKITALAWVGAVLACTLTGTAYGQQGRLRPPVPIDAPPAGAVITTTVRVEIGERTFEDVDVLPFEIATEAESYPVDDSVSVVRLPSGARVVVDPTGQKAQGVAQDAPMVARVTRALGALTLERPVGGDLFFFSWFQQAAAELDQGPQRRDVTVKVTRTAVYTVTIRPAGAVVVPRLDGQASRLDTITGAQLPTERRQAVNEGMVLRLRGCRPTSYQPATERISRLADRAQRERLTLSCDTFQPEAGQSRWEETVLREPQ